ncbi:MAG: aquaporin [Taibaiella sp.]|nr:aquaporin [Taibaiella sp.]
MKKYISEFLGTYFLVFAGTGAIIINSLHQGVITHAGIAITFGLVVMSMIYAFGDISGAHLNPAVSIAFTLAKKFPAAQLLPYILFQLAGAIAASATLRLLFPANELLGATLPSGTEAQSFTMELLLTFFLMLVILSVSSDGKEKGMFAGLAIGAVVALEAMFAGPVCGASMNPARSIGPAIISGHLYSLWLYIAAPVLGAALAVPLVRILNNSEK